MHTWILIMPLQVLYVAQCDTTSKKKIAINLIRYTDTKSIDFNASYRKDSRLVFFSSLNCWQLFFLFIVHWQTVMENSFAILKQVCVILGITWNYSN